MRIDKPLPLGPVEALNLFLETHEFEATGPNLWVKNELVPPLLPLFTVPPMTIHYHIEAPEDFPLKDRVEFSVWVTGVGRVYRFHPRAENIESHYQNYRNYHRD